MVLYVADTYGGVIYAFDVQSDGFLANRRIFARVSGWPDGIKVDVKGNLYVTTNLTFIEVYDSDGGLIGTLPIGERTENCAFGGPNNRTLFVTGGTSVYRIHMAVQGARSTLSPPDLNSDLEINIDDLIILIEHWGQSDLLCDIAPPPFGDSNVDALDLELLMSYWGQTLEDPTLLAHWKLDEPEGDVAYDNAGENDAALIGGPVWMPEAGHVGGALQFDGMDDYVSTDHVLDPSEGEFGVFAWVQGGAPGQTITSQQTGVNWLLVKTDGTLMTELRSSGRRPSPLYSQRETVITDGNWHRIGFTWDGSNRILYVDDAVVAEDAESNLAGASGGLYIGTSNSRETGTFWSGLIDDVRIYDRVVTP